MRKSLIFIYLIFLCSSINASDKNINIKLEIDSLLALSRESKLKVDSDASLGYAYRALALSDKINYSKGKARAYFDIGQNLFYLGSYEKSFEYLSLAEKEHHARKSAEIMFEISRVKGQIYSYLKLHNQSIREFQKCLTYLRNIKSIHDKDYCLSLTFENLSVVYGELNKPDSVIYFIEKNRDLLESMDESLVYLNKVNMYTSMGDYYAENGKYDFAEKTFENALNLADKYQIPYVSRTFLFLGDMEIRRGNTNSAKEYYFKALGNLDKTKIKSEYPTLYERLSDLYDKTSDADSASYYNAKQASIEKELSIERDNSVEHAFRILINEEISSNMKSRSTINAIVAILISSLLLLFYILWKTSNKRLIEKKEKEKLQLKAQLKDTFKEIEEKDRESKILTQKLNESFDEVIEMAKANDPLFTTRFKDVYPELSQSLLKKHPNLLKTEFSLCAMIALNFSSKDIARYTFVEHRSIQTKKSRLRKKLNLPAGSNLEQYLQSLT